MILASFFFGGFWRSQFVILSRRYDLKYEVVECLQTIILLSSLPVALEEEASKISKFAIVVIFSTLFVSYELVIVTLMMLSLYLWSVSVDRKTHYLKSQIFVQKFNFDKTPTFSRVFDPKNRQFSRKMKVEFLDKKWRF